MGAYGLKTLKKEQKEKNFKSRCEQLDVKVVREPNAVYLYGSGSR